MKLYGTKTSPYARIIRIVIFEKKLEDKIELVWAKTRVPGDPMLKFNLSGRVPFLLLDDGMGIEDTPVLVQFLDSLKNPILFSHGTGEFDLEYLRLEAITRSILDGLSVWLREIRRPLEEKSATIIEHEKCRSQRLIEHFNGFATNALLNGSINLAQLYLFAALDLERQIPLFIWRQNNINLINWFERMGSFQSIKSSWQSHTPK
jgi:glutathione S-transferase